MDVFYIDWLHLGDAGDSFGNKADNHLKVFAISCVHSLNNYTSKNMNTYFKVCFNPLLLTDDIRHLSLKKTFENIAIKCEIAQNE